MKAGNLMLNDYFSIKKEYDKLIYISNLLHDIKYNEDIDGLYAKYGDIDLSGMDDFDGDEFTGLCVLATYVEQAFNNKGLSGPVWVYDKRLFLPEPKYFLSDSPALLLHAMQACLNHNVFMERNNFEVY